MLAALAVTPLLGQEAQSGFDLSATVTGQAAYSNLLTRYPRNGSGAMAGFRSVLYPTWKLNSHWIVSGAVEAYSRPYFSEDYTDQGYGVRVGILQANIGYLQVWKNASLVVRAGQLTSAFGSFLLHYDDADNALTDAPMEYGYYGTGVTTFGLAGAEADLTVGKWDARAQFTNSSPASVRSIFDNDQYGDWTGGGGYTIRQGLRVGISAYRGPYLYAGQQFYRPGLPYRDLPASAWGADVEWARGHWNVQGEWQRFDLAYNQMPTLREEAGYVEARRVLSPRWYVAGRAGYLHTDYGFGGETYETVAGFRPNTHQVIKAGYELCRDASGRSGLAGSVTLQVVTTVHPLSLAYR
jgi:hypothetical protein